MLRLGEHALDDLGGREDRAPPRLATDPLDQDHVSQFTGDIYETLSRFPGSSRWLGCLRRDVRTSPSRGARRLDGSLQRRFVYDARNEEGRLFGPQRREGLVCRLGACHHPGQVWHFSANGNACPLNSNTRADQGADHCACNDAGCRWRSGPSLGEYELEGLPLPWNQVLRQDQARRIHDRSGGEGGWQSCRPRKGLFFLT
jgi:hypothetical protein